MSEMAVRTKTLAPSSTETDGRALVIGLARLIPGLQPGGPDGVEDRVSLRSPSYTVRRSEQDWKALLADEAAEGKMKRRALLEQIRAILKLDQKAKHENRALGEAATLEAERQRKALEGAWVALLSQNRAREESIRSAALFFSNLQDSRKALKSKIYCIDASAAEIASDTGRELLERQLSEFVDRPDPRSSRAFILVQGFPGSATALDRLGRAVHKHRAVLITDAPCYDSMEDLHAASLEGGLLESLPGEAVHHRHMVAIANRGRARHAFRGRFARETGDVFIPMSGPWFGSYLDNIVRGLPWKPAVGYRNPISGVDGVQLDLRLTDYDGHGLYLRHRLNPCVLLSSGSQRVVVWGPDALSKSGKGVQIGVAIVEMILVRYAEWIVNQYGLLEDLDEAEKVVNSKLSEFMVINSGAGRMFRAGSHVSVLADQTNRALKVKFELRFREVSERAVIEIAKSVDRDKRGERGDVNASSD